MKSTRKQTRATHPVVMVDAGSWRWACVPKWQALISETAGIRWDSLTRHAGAELLKDNELRSVWRVSIGEQTVVAKVFRPPEGWAWLKAKLFGPPGKREFEAAQFGQAHELSVVRPVAYGRRADKKTGCRVLLTEQIPDAQSLSAYWLDKADSSGRRTLAIDNAIVTRAAAFLESLHRAGFVPADLHPENILVDRDDRYLLVDLHKARFDVPVTQVLRILNLADLNQWFRRHADRTARLRFLLAYLTYTMEQPSPRVIRKYVRETEEVTGWKSEKLEKKRDRRIFGDNRYFGVLTLPGNWRAHVYLQAKRPLRGSRCSRLQFGKSDWVQALEPLLSAEEGSDPTELRLGPHVVPVRVERTGEQTNGLWARWQEGHMQINRHRTVPLPLALMQHSVGHREIEAVLITERSDPA